MWLVVSCVAALAVTIVWLAVNPITSRNYYLSYLALMLWGLSVMIFIDHVLGYEGGPFLEMETDGLITNGVVLGICMLIPIFGVWESALAFRKIQGKLDKPIPIKG